MVDYDRKVTGGQFWQESDRCTRNGTSILLTHNLTHRRFFRDNDDIFFQFSKCLNLNNSDFHMDRVVNKTYFKTSSAVPYTCV